MNWYSWLESEFQTDSELCEWKLYHDGDGVAIMQGPEIVAAIEPKAVTVYDHNMLAEDPADSDRLDWRIFFTGKFNLVDRPFFPMYLSGLHMYSGSDGKDRNADVNTPQKIRIAIASMLRSFKQAPSIVAGLEQGTCMQVFMGDWNLNEPQMKEALKVVLADVHEQSRDYQGRTDHNS